METTKQKTLKGSFSLCGKGLHTGLNLTVTFNPAPENTGYKIQRIDLEGQPIIDAVAEKVAAIMGVEAGAGEKIVANVRCKGTCDATKEKYEYSGIQDCRAAASLIASSESIFLFISIPASFKPYINFE